MKVVKHTKVVHCKWYSFEATEDLTSVKVDITHIAMEIDFQTCDHVVTMERLAEQCISPKCSKFNNFQVTSDFTHYGRY